MNKDIDKVAEVFTQFLEHPTVTNSFYNASRPLIAASLTAAYFAYQGPVVLERPRRDPGKKRVKP